MVSKLRSWWEQIQKYRKAISVGAIVLMAVIGLIIIGYLFDWTGFGGYSIIWTPKATHGTSLPITRLEEQQPSKTLWDWLQLLATLAVPVVVGFGAAWFTAQQGKVSDRENKDNQRETALQAYIDKISELLLNYHLDELTTDGKLKPEYEQTRKIARVRTITILFQLDARRIGYIFAFLREAGLMSNKPNNSIVSLSLADLSKINLSGANLIQANLIRAELSEAILMRATLSDANLSGADLMRATLSEAILMRADLSDANLSGANLSGADLSDANLSGAVITEEQLKEAKSLQGATLPDGTKHA